jgi:chorismate-pyruvate lyase
MGKADSQVEQEFDPFANIFVAQEMRPPHLTDIDPYVLNGVERTLLIIDGTVTRFLEAYYAEPIKIINIGETRETLLKDHKWLELAKGEEIVSRRVLLCGVTSGRTYASAASLVVPDRVKAAVRKEPGDISQGLGRLLLEGRTEQFRELLWYGKEAPTELPGELRSLGTEFSITRTYRIIVNQKPTMMISEWFELRGDGKLLS